MVFKKRQMMFVPEANPKSFVLFFEKGDTGLSWSFHDYSVRGPFKRSERSDFGWTADQVREKAQYSFDAPTVSTNEFDFWHERTLEYNKTYLEGAVESASVSRAEIVECPKPIGAKEIIAEFLRVSQKIHNKGQLAEAAKISPSTISRIAAGHYQAGKEIRMAVAKVINNEKVINGEIPCTPDDLLPPPHLLKASERK